MPTKITPQLRYLVCSATSLSERIFPRHFRCVFGHRCSNKGVRSPRCLRRRECVHCRHPLCNKPLPFPLFPKGSPPISYVGLLRNKCINNVERGRKLTSRIRKFGLNRKSNSREQSQYFYLCVVSWFPDLVVCIFFPA